MSILKHKHMALRQVYGIQPLVLLDKVVEERNQKLLLLLLLLLGNSSYFYFKMAEFFSSSQPPEVQKQNWLCIPAKQIVTVNK